MEHHVHIHLHTRERPRPKARPRAGPTRFYVDGWDKGDVAVRAASVHETRLAAERLFIEGETKVSVWDAQTFDDWDGESELPAPLEDLTIHEYVAELAAHRGYVVTNTWGDTWPFYDLEWARKFAREDASTKLPTQLWLARTFYDEVLEPLEMFGSAPEDRERVLATVRRALDWEEPGEAEKIRAELAALRERARREP